MEMTKELTYDSSKAYIVDMRMNLAVETGRFLESFQKNKKKYEENQQTIVLNRRGYASFIVQKLWAYLCAQIAVLPYLPSYDKD